MYYQSHVTRGSKERHLCTGTMDEQKTLASVEEYYGKVLATSKDLKTSACTAAKRPHRLIIDAMRKIPDEVMAKEHQY